MAVGAIVAAVALRAQLGGVLGDRVPFLLPFLAVVAAAAYGGFGPGLLATGLGIVLTALLPSVGWLGGEADWTPAILRFGTGGVLASFVAHRLRRDAAALRSERERRAEELARINRELHDRVEELQSLFESAPVAIWVAHDPELDRVTGNQLARTLFSSHDRGTAVPPPIDLDEYRIESGGAPLAREDLPLRRTIRLGVPDRDREIEVIGRDGGRRVFTVNSTPLQDGSGRTRGAISVALEVTERRRAEAARAQLAGIVDSSDDSIIGTTLDGIITSWNRGAQRLYGWSAEEAVGRSIALVIPPERSSELEVIVERLRAGERIEHFETARLHADGTRIQVSTTVSPIVDENGRTIGASAITRDIGPQRRTEVTLRFLAEASESLAQLVDYRSTLQTVARLAVPGFADWCAVDMLSPGGAIERLAVAHVDPSKVELARELYDRYPPDPGTPYGVPRVLRTGVSERVAEITDEMIRRAAPNEEVRSIVERLGMRSYMVVPLRLKDRTLGAISFVAAESGRRYDAGDLAAAEDLARRAAIAIDNARLYQELREADRRKDEFLAVLSHELRNPLAPIRTGIDMLAMESKGEDQLVEIMRQQVEHLVRLVDDLLDISRITRGRVELRKEPVELASVLERAAAAMKSTFAARRQTLELTPPRAEVPLDADPVRLLQILENLLQNASKFSDDGGRVELHAATEAGQAVIRVRDHGIGIEPALLQRLFEPFTQSSHSIDRAQGGLGIGLALVRGLVERHGGTVTATSAGRGRGSEFVVRLPLGDVAPAPGSSSARPGPASDVRRILVVDDNQAAARMLTLLLERLGQHDVDTAHDGPSALASVRARHPEMVLLDLGLPLMDGYEVGRAIRRDRELDDVLLVALTGYGHDEDRRRSRAAGFDEHLVKPPAIEEIARLFEHPKLRKPRSTVAGSAPPG